MWFRRRRAARGIPDDLEGFLDGWCRISRHLPDDLRVRHRELTAALASGLRFEAARGLDLTDEMRLVVSAHAAVLVTGLDEGADLYQPVTSIILHRSTITQTGPRPGPWAGAMTDSPLHMSGQAHHRGPVLLSWNTVRNQSLHPQRGEHVVYHEMAHRLDMLDGSTDGTPPLGGTDLHEPWVEVFTRELAALRNGDASPALRSYAATNPAEFFAVATESFLCRTHLLAEHHADLYGLLRDFYRLDPVAWVPDDRPPGDRPPGDLGPDVV